MRESYAPIPVLMQNRPILILNTNAPQEKRMEMGECGACDLRWILPGFGPTSSFPECRAFGRIDGWRSAEIMQKN